MFYRHRASALGESERQLVEPERVRPDPRPLPLSNGVVAHQRGPFCRTFWGQSQDSDGPALYSDHTALRPIVADLQGFRAQRRTRTGGLFLTMAAFWR